MISTNSALLRLQRHAALPLVAILRGIRPHEVVPHSEALVAEGFQIIEVPLNSPDALQSIEILSRHWGEQVLVGAGTVLAPKEVDAVVSTGGQLIVTPNTDLLVIARCNHHGTTSLIGCVSPTEALAAHQAGATALKLFPAAQFGTTYLSAIKVVLPADLAIYPVGGIEPDNMEGFLRAGAAGFGVASNLYRPGQPIANTSSNARRLISAWHTARLHSQQLRSSAC